MTIRPIVIAGDPVFYTPTQPVTEDVPELHELTEDMCEIMDRVHGVGPVANQVGVGKCLSVYNCLDDDDVWHRGCVINPVLTTSEIPKAMPNDDGSDGEGCLSVPGLSFPTNRVEKVIAIGLDENGEEARIKATGFLARRMQHEVGHPDGFLYIDCPTGRWKRMAKKEIKCAGWTEGGPTWMPGVGPNPFGYED